MSFVSQQRVRFGDCDPAGIAYFPRLLEHVDAAVEDWTPIATGVTRREMHQQYGLGLPTGSLATRFLAPARLEEMLDIEVVLSRVGRSSIELTVDARCDGARRFVATLKQVLIRLSTGRATAWPEPWRASLLGHVEVATA